MCRLYGVEAGRACIIDQITTVFGVYGITVDERHLGLIADYMTYVGFALLFRPPLASPSLTLIAFRWCACRYEGGFRALNRIGMANHGSPFTQMSFETTAKFLVDSTLHGTSESLQSPSARIAMGRLIDCGTGSFDIMQPLKF